MLMKIKERLKIIAKSRNMTKVNGTNFYQKQKKLYETTLSISLFAKNYPM